MKGNDGLSGSLESEDEEVRRRSGSKVWSREMSGASGVVEGISEGIETTLCELKSQPVHACAGNPIPFSKVSGQVPVAVSDSYANPRITPHSQSPSSFTPIQGCSSRPEPEFIAHVADPPSKRRAGRYIPELTDDVKTRSKDDGKTRSKELGPDQRTCLLYTSPSPRD